MHSKDILKEALNLEPAEKFIIVEGLLKSLDEPITIWMSCGQTRQRRDWRRIEKGK